MFTGLVRTKKRISAERIYAKDDELEKVDVQVHAANRGRIECQRYAHARKRTCISQTTYENTRWIVRVFMPVCRLTQVSFYAECDEKGVRIISIMQSALRAR
jgi:hypothetical protein